MERNVTYDGANGARISATLTMPEVQLAGQLFPAMLLVQGSGPTDRDGNQSPHYMTDLLKMIAGELARKGIASLRYDKRGMHANIDDRPKDIDSATQFARWDFQVGDAAAGFRFLAQQPGVDSARIGVFGHSEGGLIALELAAGEAVALRVSPAAMVLAATPGRKLGAVLANQLDRIMIRQGVAEDERKAVLAKNAEIVAHIVENAAVPSDVPQGLAALYPPYLRLFLHAILKLDPQEFARRVEAPVLLLNGDCDPQVLADLDARPLAVALAASAPAPTTLCIIAGASHALKPTAGMDENNPAGDIAPAALNALSDWLKDIGWSN